MNFDQIKRYLNETYIAKLKLQAPLPALDWLEAFLEEYPPWLEERTDTWKNADMHQIIAIPVIDIQQGSVTQFGIAKFGITKFGITKFGITKFKICDTLWGYTLWSLRPIWMDRQRKTWLRGRVWPGRFLESEYWPVCQDQSNAAKYVTHL